jgi:nicotinamidase-related amidase
MDVDLTQGRCAVVVLDVQRVFAAPDGPFSNSVAGPMIDAINRLVAGAREQDVSVVHSRYVLRDDLRDAGLLSGMDAVQQGHMSRSSPLSAIDDRVDVAPTDILVEHNRPSAFFRSDLEAVLAAEGADRVVLAGLSVNNAISATARDAFARDIPAVVVREAVGAAPFEPARELEAYFTALHTWTAEVAPLDAVLRRLAA